VIDETELTALQSRRQRLKGMFVPGNTRTPCSQPWIKTSANTANRHCNAATLAPFGLL